MKIRFLFLVRIIFVCSLVFAVGSSASFYGAQEPAPKAQETAPKVSEAESKAALAINSAPDAAAKLASAGEFLKKYPTSALRLQVAGYVASQISQVADATQKLSLVEGFKKLFTAEKELETIQLIALEAYLNLKRVDDAFAHGATILAKEPENVAVMSHLALAGAEEAKRQNSKHVPVSMQYGLKAIELIEANKKPVLLDDARWENQKSMLPFLYLNMGVLSLVSGNPTEAKARFEKATVLNPGEPTSYALLGNIVDNEYQELAKTYKTLPEGQQKEATLKKATELMDQAIGFYAKALGVSAGKPEHKLLYDQILEVVTPYYKFRHNGSIDGLQQLIDKNKVPATP